MLHTLHCSEQLGSNVCKNFVVNFSNDKLAISVYNKANSEIQYDATKIGVK